MPERCLWRDSPAIARDPIRFSPLARKARVAPVLVVAFIFAQASSTRAFAWGRKIVLARKYRPGQKMIYKVKTQTRLDVRASPAEVGTLLPPLPAEFSTQQEDTVIVRAVHGDGTVDLEVHFDRFDVQNKFADGLPEAARGLVRQTEQDLIQKIDGATLTAHFDREGRLLGIEGADQILQQWSAPFREPLRELLALILEQMNGNALYPGHEVALGQEWRRKFTSQPSGESPDSMESESVLRYSGKTKLGKVKAAAIDFSFTSAHTPDLAALLRDTPLAGLESKGLDLEVRVNGSGQGRALLALNDGRILQDQSTMDQTLTTRLKSLPGIKLPTPDPITFEFKTATQLEVEGSGKDGR